jgi:hypothetical protein
MTVYGLRLRVRAVTGDVGEDDRTGADV